MFLFINNKLFKNKKAFTLIEMLLSSIIAGIAIVAVMNFFSIDMKINNLRYSLLNESNTNTGIENIRSIIKEGYMNDNGSPATNIPTTQTNSKVVFYTTYFSKSKNTTGSTYDSTSAAKPYAIEYLNNQIIIYPISTPSAYSVLINNVTSCNVSYYDLNSSNTTTTADIRMVSFDITYNNNNTIDTVKILAKMMQET